MNKHQKELLAIIHRENEEKASAALLEAVADQKEPQYPPIASEDKEAIAKEAPCYGTLIAEGKHEFAGSACVLCGLKRGGWFPKDEPRMTQFGE